MSALELSPELVESVQRAVAAADERAQDDGVAVQYLAAIIGLMLGNAPLESQRKKELLRHLCGMAEKVIEDVERQADAPPQQEAFGIWQPGD